MSAPDPREAEIAALREEIAELRARLAALEDFVGLHGREDAAPAPPSLPDDFDPFALPEAPAIEPSEPWGLRPRGGDGER